MHGDWFAVYKVQKGFMCNKYPDFLILYLLFTDPLYSKIFIKEMVENCYKIKQVMTKICFLQDFLICIEMFMAAVAHHFTFSHRPYIDITSSPQRSCCQSFLHMWDVSDVQRDIKEHFGVVGKFYVLVIIKVINNDHLCNEIPLNFEKTVFY
jgi:hypothetical protein